MCTSSGLSRTRARLCSRVRCFASWSSRMSPRIRIVHGARARGGGLRGGRRRQRSGWARARRSRGHLRPRDPRPAAAARSTGSRVLRELQSPLSRTCPVVIVSARSDLRTKLRGFKLGANDYLAKPFALRRAARAGARPASRTRQRPRRHVLAGRRRSCSTSRAGRPRIGDARRSTSPTASSACCITSSSTPARWSRATASCPRSGATTSTPGRTSSTSACAACAGSSARKRRSRPCGMPGYRITTA